VLEPDAKSQVTLRYEDGRPVEVLQIVVSTQHKKRAGLQIATPKRLHEIIRPYVESVFPEGLLTKKTKWHVNPTAGLARRCTIQISYAIGVAQPLSFYVDLHGTGAVDAAILEKALPELIGGATPRAIREHLGLNKPIYARTSAYGHFGRTPDSDGGFSWEKTDLVDQLRKLG
jgi:S-adenosylmethionine synthetase